MSCDKLQLSLPFTVLKRFAFDAYHIMEFVIVAIVLTVYGIETGLHYA